MSAGSTMVPAVPAATRAAAAPTAAERAWALALGTVLKLEGGYQADPTDPGNANGGATNLGITRATLAASRGVAPEAVTREMVRLLTREEAARIYARDYWVPCGADRLAAAGRAALAIAQFDWAVNGGEARARWYLQAALNLGCPAKRPALVVDGRLGPRTWAAVAALTAAEETAAVAAHLRLRLGHYRLRAALGTAAERAQLAATLTAAGLPPRLLPKPSADARGWYRGWVHRLTRIAAAAGLGPPAGA